MRGKPGRVALCLLLLVGASHAFAQRRPLRPLRVARAAKTVPPVVQRALDAAETLRFAGRRTVTVLKDGQPNRHEEIVMRDGPLVRVEFPSDGAYAGQVIVEDGAQRRHFLPRTNEVQVLPPRGEEGLRRLKALARAGSLTLENGGRIAGYPTTEVVVHDRSGNVLQRLAVEPNSGMVLRRRIYDATGVEVGGYVFSKIDLSPSPFDPALFRIERKGVKTVTVYDRLRRLAQRSGYVAAQLPESTGYRLDTCQIAQLNGPILVQNYVGPSGVRVSLDQVRRAVNPDSLRRQGGKQLLHSLSWTEAGITFVLLGPVDDAALVRLRQAVVRG